MPRVLKLTGENRKDDPLNVSISRLRDKPMRNLFGTARIRPNHSDCANPDLRKGTISWSIELRGLRGAILDSADRLPGEHLGAVMRYPPSPLTSTGHALKSQSPHLVRSSSLPIDLSRSGRAMNESRRAASLAVEGGSRLVPTLVASPGCNRLLGHACLERLKTSRREHLARLRANRRAAWELMADLGAELPSQVEPQSSGPRVEPGTQDIPDSRRHCTGGPGTPRQPISRPRSCHHYRRAKALPPRIARTPIGPGVGACRRWKLHLFEPTPSNAALRGRPWTRKPRPANDRSSRIGSPSPPAHIPTVLPTAVTGSTLRARRPSVSRAVQSQSHQAAA